MSSTLRSRLKATYIRTILQNPYIPEGHKPHPKQAEFLLATDPKTGRPYEEILFGGAGGPGKSDGLLMAALQYVEVPGYAALIIRKTFSDLKEPGALIDRSREWLSGTDASYNETDKIWTFPRFGSKFSFGFLANESDKYRYKSSEFQFIGFDELTDFRESDYTYLFSRLRGPDLEKEPDNPLARVPWRMRGATNPGGYGHLWVKDRWRIYPEHRPDKYAWIETPWVDDETGEEHRRLFIPAYAEDNLSRSPENYLHSLASLDPVTRARMRNGDWEAEVGGGLFWRHLFEIVAADTVPVDARAVRAWDLAATEKKKGNNPDWTAGLRLGEKQGIYFVQDVRRVRESPLSVDRLMRATAIADGYKVRIGFEQEPGASGKRDADRIKREVLKGYPSWSERPSGDKVTRAQGVSSAAEAGNVKIVRGEWNRAFLDELELFPLGANDDQVDALSLAYRLVNRKVGTVQVMKKRSR